jgi:hypothetical protein
LIVDLKKSEYLPGDYLNQNQNFEQVSILVVLVQSGTTGGGVTQLQNRGAVEAVNKSRGLHVRIPAAAKAVGMVHQKSFAAIEKPFVG